MGAPPFSLTSLSATPTFISTFNPDFLNNQTFLNADIFLSTSQQLEIHRGIDGFRFALQFRVSSSPRIPTVIYPLELSELAPSAYFLDYFLDRSYQYHQKPGANTTTFLDTASTRFSNSLQLQAQVIVKTPASRS